MLKSRADIGGFTLIEVMVALAVFALAASMLMLSDGTSIRQTRYMQEKVLASQIADHYLNVLQAENRWSKGGAQSRIQEYAGLEWYVSERISDSSLIDLKKVIIEVFPGSDEPDDDAVPLSRLETYIRRVKK
ncbi:type II secretion system protein GspI [Endozoicomonas sp. (ex Bugula neritina AB1)]|nr:type II secretion system protein GspI [Endozoicomonas sp. (ex Bugula neritina AB1)]